jgi:molybdopterin-binding protein
MPTTTPALVLRDLRVEADGRTILDIPHFEVESEGVLAVLGPNGAGKSTLLRVLAGLSKPSGGSLAFSRGEGEVALRRRTAFVFQDPYLWTGSVRRNLELGLKFRRVGSDEVARRVESIAEQLSLGSLLERNAGALSGGEAQRVALARALVLDPDILFLDEPSSNLDAEARAALREDLDRVARARASAIVLATHDRPDAFYLADRIAVLREGRVVQQGTPQELFEHPVDPFIAGITGAELSFRGTVSGVDEELLSIHVGGADFVAVGTAEPGDMVKVAYRPEDLFLSAVSIEGGSARNRFVARVSEVRSLGALVRIRLAGPADMVAVVTRAAAAELGATAGQELWVQVKATALHAFRVQDIERQASSRANGE